MTSITSSTPQGYTIVRIKRKRTDEPLDALVVESKARRKKTREGLDVFQFAETVEEVAWRDEQLRKDLQSRLSQLYSNTPETSTSQPDNARILPQQNPQNPLLNQLPAPSRRYKVRPLAEQEKPKSSRFMTSPPKVLSSKDLPPKDGLKMYDAILDNSGMNEPALDPEMEKFLPMLQDYLRLNEIDAPGIVSRSTTSSPGPTTSKGAQDDYVWDVFYRRPATLSEWNSVANVATLSGLPPVASDMYDSDTDESEPDDEADEDSNAEEYYKNDYPDEEESDDSNSSDMFHENQEYDDGG